MDEEFYRALEQVSADLYYRALTVLPIDVREALHSAAQRETSPTGKRILELIERNIATAVEQKTLVCQDTGFPIYYLEVGNLDIQLGRAQESVRAGVARSTKEHHLRPNMVHPLTRVNTGDNTGRGAPTIFFEPNPALGRTMRVLAMPKGSGSENMSALAMLSPADGIDGVERFVLQTVADAGGKGCPPYIVGVGIGGTFETVTHLSKKALLRRLAKRGDAGESEALEARLLEKVNRLGLGPMGLGGSVTAIAVNVEWAETHISSLPVAVNIQCWRGEWAEATLDEHAGARTAASAGG